MMVTRHERQTAELLRKLAADLHAIKLRLGYPYYPGCEDERDKQGRPLPLPSRPRDIEQAFKECHLDSILQWLRLNMSVQIADDLEQRLRAVHANFSLLEFEAAKVINGDPLDAKETVNMPFAVKKLFFSHHEALRKLFPDDRPERSDMPPAMQWVEVRFLDKYAELGCDLREVVKVLGVTAAIIDGRQIEEDGPAGVGYWRHGGKVNPNGDGKPLTDKPWRFAKALFEAMPGSVQHDDLAEPVLGDRHAYVEVQQAKNWQMRAKNFFNNNRIPLAITKSSDSYTMKKIPRGEKTPMKLS